MIGEIAMPFVLRKQVSGQGWPVYAVIPPMPQGRLETLAVKYVADTALATQFASAEVAERWRAALGGEWGVLTITRIE